MPEDTQKTLAQLEEKIDTLSENVRIMRRYFFMSTILNIVMILLPLLIVALFVPFLLGSLEEISQLYLPA